MTISDAEFQAWLESSTKRPVVLVDIEATTPAGGSETLRIATGRYLNTDNIYRARLRDFELQWRIESGVAGFSEIRYGALEIINNDGALDDWHAYTLGAVTMRYGDQSWDFADFRKRFVGRVWDKDADSGELRWQVRDKQDEADLIVEDITVADALPGTMCQELLTTHGPYAPADLDVPAWDALDTDYPYTCTLDTAGRKNILDLVDEVLAGLPVDYGPDLDGILTVFTFRKPSGSSSHRVIKPLSEPEVEVIAPLGEVTLKHGAAADVTREDAIIKADYANWRSETFTVAIQAEADRQIAGDERLALFNEEDRRIRLEAKDDLWGLTPGMQVPLSWPHRKGARYGVDETEAIITGLTLRYVGNHELEAIA